MTITNLYERLGNATGVRQLVDTFYDYMDTLPEAKLIRSLHPADLSDSRDKLYFFLSGWSGGPELYRDKYGHPRLRMRHLPFPIGEEERDQWLHCMGRALADCVEDTEVRSFMSEKFSQIADFMRNKEP